MPFVLDSSVALAWLLPDEHDDATDALADRLGEAAAVVPTLWYPEVANALLMAARRQRLAIRDMNRLLAAIIELPLETDVSHPGEHIEAIVELARRHTLTIYDATYLELAQRRSLPLATLDTRMREAARAAGASCLP